MKTSIKHIIIIIIIEYDEKGSFIVSYVCAIILYTFVKMRKRRCNNTTRNTILKLCTLFYTAFWGCFSSPAAAAAAVSLNLLCNYFFFYPKNVRTRTESVLQTHWNLLKLVLVSEVIFWSIFYVWNWKEIVDDYFIYFLRLLIDQR